jgi:hypothetical protein
MSTICSKYYDTSKGFSDYQTKIQQNFNICEQDKVFLNPAENDGNLTSSKYQTLITGQGQVVDPKNNQTFTVEICPSDPCSVLNNYSYSVVKYGCSSPGFVPCTDQQLESSCLSYDYGSSQCQGTSQCQTTQAFESPPGNCFNLNSVCVPQQPFVSVDNPDLFLPKNKPFLTTAVDCCLGKYDNETKDFTCGIGLCKGGSTCKEIMTSYCTGDAIITDPKCVKYMKFDSKVKDSDKETKKELFYNFLTYLQNQNQYAPDDPANPYNLSLLQICQDTRYTDFTTPDTNPCEDFLNTYCKKITISTDKLESNLDDDLTKLCGCYLPSYPYEGLVSTPNCQPLCLNSPAIFQKLPCGNSNCVIDINIANAVVKGIIDISSICISQNNAATCNFTEDAYNHFALSENKDTSTQCGGCNLVDAKGNVIQGIQCPKSGSSTISNCKTNADCKSNLQCQNSVCIIPSQPSTNISYTLLLSGIAIIVFILVIVGSVFLYRYLNKK